MPRGRGSRRGRRPSRIAGEKYAEDSEDEVQLSQTDETDSQSLDVKNPVEAMDISGDCVEGQPKDTEEEDELMDSTAATDNAETSNRRLTEGDIDVDDADSVSAEDDAVDADEDDTDDVLTPAEKAARICRLPAKETVKEELNLFPFLEQAQQPLVDAYLCIRNHACMLWSEAPFSQVTISRLSPYVTAQLSNENLRLMCAAGLISSPPTSSSSGDVDPQSSSTSPDSHTEANQGTKKRDNQSRDVPMFPVNWSPWTAPDAKANLERMCYLAILFLERYGYINFGLFKILATPLTHVSIPRLPSAAPAESPSTPRRAAAERALAITRRSASSGSIPSLAGSPATPHFIILGAGMAGLIAARQLMYFGAKVTVLESRNRVGGRIWTCKKGDALGELGAMVVTGLAANPISVLAKQIPLTLTPINVECSLYDPKGRQISREIDEKVEEEFNRLLGTAAFICHTKAMETITNELGEIKPLSLGEVIDQLIRYQERHKVQLKVTHRQLISKLLHRKNELLDKIATERQNIEEAYDRWQTATARANTCSVVIAPRITSLNAFSTSSPDHSSITVGADQREAVFKESDILWDPRPISKPGKPAVPENKSDAGQQNTTPESQPAVLPVYNVSMQFEVRRLLSELHDAWKRFEPLETALNRVNRQLEILMQSPPRDVYLTDDERRTLDWHLANLEFANATQLSNLSLRHWDQDDVFELGGEHCIIREGYGSVTDALASAISNSTGATPNTKARELSNILGSGHVELKCSVKRIVYSETGVRVDAVNAAFSQDDLLEHEADAVICSLPLGVLKESVRLDQPPQTRSPRATASTRVVTTPENLTKIKAPVFQPPLPEWKVDAINRLGFGVLNKVILFFDKCFWDRSQNLFGHVSANSDTRGELFLFWSISDRPVLIALVAGRAAEDLEQARPVVPSPRQSPGSRGQKTGLHEPIVARAMQILRSIFGSQDSAGNNHTDRKKVIPNPVEAIVTRWYSDADSRGSYSYVSVNATGQDYDTLGEPVSVQSTDTTTTAKSIPRLFFAGEHTCRCYPATVHGALLSGLREAARVANTFCPGQTPIVQHGLKLFINPGSNPVT